METEADINRTVEAAAEIICKGDAEVSIDPVDLNIKDNLIDPISSMRQSLLFHMFASISFKLRRLFNG